MSEKVCYEVKQIMKKATLWKCAAFGIVCISQEFEVYKILAQDRFFDMSKFLKKTVEHLWKVTATGYSVDEQYVQAVEESFFEPRNTREELALQIVQDMYDFCYAINEKDSVKLLEMQECQIKLIKKYLLLKENASKAGQNLLEKVQADHLSLATEIVKVPNKEKKNFLSILRSKEFAKILGEDFAEACPVGKKEKAFKKKLSEIRATSLEFDREAKENDNTWLLDSVPEQWVLGQNPKTESYKGAYYEDYYKKDLLNLSYIMRVKYKLMAADDYVSNRIPERARGFWYLSAFSFLRAYQLYEKGYPVNRANTKYYLERHESGQEGFQPIFDCMIHAYASGEDSLLPEIHYFSSEAERPRTTALLKVFKGEENPELYLEIESWNDSDIKRAILAILQRDKKEIRKVVLHMIRHDRKQYDMNRTMVDPYAYSCLRLAKECGIEMESILAAEVLDGNLEMAPLDKKYWKLPYHEEIDEWLKRH